MRQDVLKELESAEFELAQLAEEMTLKVRSHWDPIFVSAFISIEQAKWNVRGLPERNPTKEKTSG